VASGSFVSVLAALVGNLVIAMVKLVTGLAAGSSAMLAEAAHSFSDTGNQVLLLIGLQRARPSPTDRYPFGRGKSAYFWPFLVAVLLFGVAGLYSIYEGAHKVLDPHPLGSISVPLAVLAAAFVIEGIVLFIAVRKASEAAREQGMGSVGEFLRETRDATLLTVIVEDSLALVGLPIAAGSMILSVVTGNPIWDGIGSLVIGGLLMGFATFLAWRVKGLLLGRGLSERDRVRVQQVLDEDPAVDDVFNMQSMYLGHEDVLLGVEIDLADGLDSDDAEQAMDRIEATLREAVPVLSYVFVEPGTEADRFAPEETRSDAEP
jgi:cation diffusion facilitator family transporter